MVNLKWRCDSYVGVYFHLQWECKNVMTSWELVFEESNKTLESNVEFTNNSTVINIHQGTMELDNKIIDKKQYLEQD